MKKMMMILMVAALVVAMVACGAKAPEETTAQTEATEQVTAPETEAAEETEGQIAGGWQVNTEFPEFTAPEEAQAAFEKAMEGFTGVGYTPVAYLGSQVVAGVNYAFLCAATTVTAEPETTLAVVTIYQDLEGEAEVLNVTDVDVAEAVSNETETEAGLAGGWFYDEACGAGLTDDAKEAFDKAVEGYTGVGYEPLACLGTQVVAGVNYAVLCTATPATADPVTTLSVVVIYSGVDGSTEIISVAPFSVA